MSTIPSIFNEHFINTVALGGKEAVPNARMNIAVILLNKSWSQFRFLMIENLVKCGFCQIISIENDPENYNMDSFSRRYPYVRFIFPLEKTTDGELINMAVEEVKADYFLVLKDSIDFQSDILSPTLGMKLTENDVFCVAPRLLEQDNTAFPVLSSPAIQNNCMIPEFTSVVSDGLPDLMPFDYIGLYNKKKFVNLGGFDYTIGKPYWQNLDLSFRAWLWGEEIVFSTAFSLCYGQSFPSIDSTPGQSSNRFYLKNLVPRFFNDHGSIPKSAFPAFLRSSGCGLFEAWRQFKEAGQWVKLNEYNFKRDVINLVENWGSK